MPLSLIRTPLQCYQPTSMLMKCFVILENVNKSLSLSLHLLLLSVRKCRTKGRENACEIEPSPSTVRNSLQLESKCSSPNFCTES